MGQADKEWRREQEREYWAWRVRWAMTVAEGMTHEYPITPSDTVAADILRRVAEME